MSNVPLTIPKSTKEYIGPFGRKTAMPLLPWRFRVDFRMSSVIPTDYYKITNCPLGILKNWINQDVLKDGHGRWQEVEIIKLVNGKKDKWSIGTLEIPFAVFEPIALEINLHAVETTSLWVKKFALLLRDCAIDKNTGFYFPYACRHPVDIIVTTFGFKHGYSRTVEYLQCGLSDDKEYKLDYGKDDLVENTLKFICRNVKFSNISETDYTDTPVDTGPSSYNPITPPQKK